MLLVKYSLLSVLFILFLSISESLAYKNTEYKVYNRDVELVDRSGADETHEEEIDVPDFDEAVATTAAHSPETFGFDLSSFFGPRINFGFGLGFGGFGGNGGAGLGNVFSPFDTESVFEFPAERRWWLRDNVCVEKSETVEKDEDEAADDVKESADTEAKDSKDDGSVSESKAAQSADIMKPHRKAHNLRLFNFNRTACQETFNEYTCTQTVQLNNEKRTETKKYRCCFGAQRRNFNSGCEKVELKSIDETLNDLKATEFLKITKNLKIWDEVAANENVTIFVPDDMAFNRFTEKMLESNKVDVTVEALRKRRRRRDLKYAVSTKGLLSNHLVRGLHPIADSNVGVVLKSLFNEKEVKIDVCRIKSHTLATANCVPVQKRNIYAHNAIVHQIDGVMKPISHSLLEIMQSNDLVSMFRSILEKNNLMDYFESGKKYTLFVPTNEAIMKLDSNLRDSLINGEACALDFVKNHVVADEELCACALNGGQHLQNANGNGLRFASSRKNGTIFVNGGNEARIVDENVLATNGIMHVIDAVLYRNHLKAAEQLLAEDPETSEFLKLLKQSNMLAEVNSLRNVTVLVPTNAALNRSKIAATSSESDLKQLLNSHIVTETIRPCSLRNNQLLNTRAEGATTARLTVNTGLQKPHYALNCARLSKRDSNRACGSLLYKIDRVLEPVTKSLLAVIRERPDFGLFSKILEGTEAEKLLQNEDGGNKVLTVLVYPDSVFEQLFNSKTLGNLLENKKYADIWLKDFILTRSVCCSNVESGLITFDLAMTQSRNLLDISRVSDSDHDGVTFGSMRTIECDILATNGIVHAVNMTRAPSRRQHPFHGMEQWFFI